MDKGIQMEWLRTNNSKLELYMKNIYHVSMKRTTDSEIAGDFYPESFGPVTL
jgi:hypothetical protein